MSKPRIIIADCDIEYVIPLQQKFAEDYFDEVELEVITDRGYFDELFSLPQSVDILIISEQLYSASLYRHNVSHIIMMTEQYEEHATADLNVERIFKYTSIKEIFNEISCKCADVLINKTGKTQQPRVVMVYSAGGGTGKTTVAMGISAALTKNYKRVLYINASRLQSFQCMLSNKTPISSGDVYARFIRPSDNLYADIKHVIRKEIFSYLPPFKSSLLSLGFPYSVFRKIILSARDSGEYDFIVVDADVTFDEDKAELIHLADRVLVITRQDMASVFATNMLVANVNGLNEEKYLFLCNDFDKDRPNALISPDISLHFRVSDYIDHFRYYEQMKLEELADDSGIQRVAFLVN